MDFTREPIILTIITPREGYKLAVRSSKGGSQEEYTVDAVEIVSFGSALFFRSQERPKSFLLPVSDYEVLELRETRTILKTPALEKTIKIGGGKEASVKQDEEPTPQLIESPAEAKRGRRQNRKRKLEERKAKAKEGVKEPQKEEEKTPSVTLSRLLPPPPGLISETLSRYKGMTPSQEEEMAPEATPEEVVELPKAITPEESEPETEGPVPPEIAAKPPLEKLPKHIEEEEKVETQHAKEEPTSPFLEQVPKKSATPEEPPKMHEEGNGSFLSRVKASLEDTYDHFMF